MKTPPAPCGAGAAAERATPVTVGATRSARSPSTSKPAASATAWAPSPSAASFPAASRIVPPFGPSAEAGTEIPSGSASPAATA